LRIADFAVLRRKSMEQNYKSQFQNLPENQRTPFLDFKGSHPYKRITYQNQDGVIQVGRYITCGRGERVLVFLHGALVEPDMWFYPILELEDQFRIIAPHFPPVKMDALEATACIRAILQEEQVATATFIGMSYGGGVAQFLAEKHPELVENLKEIRRVLKPGGRLLLINEAYRSASPVKEKNSWWAELGDFTIHSPAELGDFVLQAGYSSVQTDTHPARNWVIVTGVK
jgi:pimeloyl-ACP methyl ester carboxylesterase